MKKLKILALSLAALTLMFAGCKNNAELQEVKTVKVSDVTKVNGKKVAQKEKVTDKADFNAIVLPSVYETIAGTVAASTGGLSDGSDDGDWNLRAAVKTITTSELEKSFNDLVEQFEKADDESSISIDWTAPTGKIDLEEDDIDLVLDTMYVKFNATSSQSGDTESATINGSAKGAGSLTVSNMEGAIPNLKLNATTGVKVTKAAVTGKESGHTTKFTSASGKVAAYAGTDSAFLFDVTSKGKDYNGVVKISASVKVDQKLTPELLNEIQTSINSVAKGNYSALDKYLTVKVTIDVYDVNGKKIFNYLEANSVSDIMTYVTSLM